MLNANVYSCICYVQTARDMITHIHAGVNTREHQIMAINKNITLMLNIL